MSFFNKIWNSEEFTKSEGFIFIRITGNTISEESSLTNIKVLEDPLKNIIIHGFEFEIQDESSSLSSFDMISESESYYTELIKGKEIDYAKFDRLGNLEISIRTEPPIKIISKIEATTNGESWQYNYKKGYIIF